MMKELKISQKENIYADNINKRCVVYGEITTGGAILAFFSRGWSKCS